MYQIIRMIIRSQSYLNHAINDEREESLSNNVEMRDHIRAHHHNRKQLFNILSCNNVLMSLFL